MSDSVVVSGADARAELSFRDLKLSPALLEAIEAAGYATPTPIQAGAIPLLLEGRDVLGQAQTGTGKTAAFAIPMLERIDLSQPRPQVLVLTPTRELAIQVAEAFDRYAANLGELRVAAIYGGQDYNVQFRQLDRGVHVIVGTPGRVMDHIRRGSLNLEGLKGLVLDEADEMLQMGFAEDVDWVLTQAPAERQIALFSATMPDAIRRIANQHLRNPAEVTIKQRVATADTVRQRFAIVAPHQKENLLAQILEVEPIDGVLIFVRLKSMTDPIAEFLASRGHRSAALSGDVPQKQRERIIDNLRSGRLDVIVATDVAARGLDVQRISHVINYDLPVDSECYVHRIGRTGRAGRSGNAILLLNPRERHILRRIELATRQTIEPMEMPTKRAINQRRVAKFHERITAALAHKEAVNYTAIIEQYQKQHNVPVEQIAAALAVMAVGESPLLLTEEVKHIASHDRHDSRGEGSPRHVRGFDDEHAGHRGPGREHRSGPQAMETFRVEVGRQHNVSPGNLVGAIANESGLGSGFIGRIEIFDDYSTVDLHAGMPSKLFYALKKVWVSGRQLNISRLGETQARTGGARPQRERPAYPKLNNKPTTKPKWKAKKKPVKAG